MPIKDRSINPPPEIPGGEGWLVNTDQQKLVQFKSLAATGLSDPPDPPQDVAPQRCRGVEDDAQDRLETVLTTGAIAGKPEAAKHLRRADRFTLSSPETGWNHTREEKQRSPKLL